MKDYILDASCKLSRNYADLPFDTLTNAETAKRVNERAMVALERSGESFAYLSLTDLPLERRTELEENRLISSDTREAVSGAAYLRMDERLCVETSGEDHLTVSVYNENGDLLLCYGECARVAAALEDTGSMARSAQFGFLTAKPCDAGTGMRAIYRLHLPMIMLVKQFPAAAKLAGSESMTLRILGNGMAPNVMVPEGTNMPAQTYNSVRVRVAVQAINGREYYQANPSSGKVYPNGVFFDKRINLAENGILTEGDLLADGK